MSNQPRKLLSLLVIPLAVTLACSSGTTSGTFELSVVIEGTGRVVSEPALIDCVGPRDCGTVSVANGTIELLAASSTGAPVGIQWTLDGIDKGRQNTFLDITGAAGERHVARATFIPIGSSGGVDGGALRDSGATDGGDGGRGSSLACYNEACATGEVCCASGSFVGGSGQGKTFCAKDCTTAGARMECQRPSDCAVGQACVPNRTDSTVAAVYSCAPAPTRSQSQLCDPTHPCPDNRCTTVISSAGLGICATSDLP